METFATLLNRFHDIRTKVSELINKGVGKFNHQIVNLALQAKSVKARLDKYGAGQRVWEVHLRVKVQDSFNREFRMVLIGLSDSEVADMVALFLIVEHRVKLEYGDKFKLHNIAWVKEVKCGVCLPA